MYLLIDICVLEDLLINPILINNVLFTDYIKYDSQVRFESCEEYIKNISEKTEFSENPNISEKTEFSEKLIFSGKFNYFSTYDKETSEFLIKNKIAHVLLTYNQISGNGFYENKISETDFSGNEIYENKTSDTPFFKYVLIEIINGKTPIFAYSLCNPEEKLFLRIGNKILSGNNKDDRTGTGTVSSFGIHQTFDLTNNTFPLLTTRKMYFKGIVEELLLFISGKTDSKILENKGVNIWKPNTSREFLDKHNLHHLPVGDMGPTYGFLFRHFGEKYIDCHTNYTGGFDQIKNIINLIKTDPNSRRLIISLWDPSNLSNSPLPPCLYNYQFYVEDEYLSCMMTQRSSDYAVAGGWNIATGALLTIILAYITNKKPKKLIWNIGDAHIYNNLKNTFKTQIGRIPYAFPKLYIKKEKTDSLDINDFTFSDFKLVNYTYHNKLNYEMSV
jgi:thymidylate synthase